MRRGVVFLTAIILTVGVLSACGAGPDAAADISLDAGVQAVADTSAVAGVDEEKQDIQASSEAITSTPTPTPKPTSKPTPTAKPTAAAESTPTVTPAAEATPDTKPTKAPTPTKEAAAEPTAAPAAEPTQKPQEETPPPAPAVASGSGCRLTSGSTISLSASFSKAPASDDGLLHVYQLAPYQYGPEGAADVGSVPSSQSPVAEFNRTDGVVDGLYCKYAFVAIQNGTPVIQGEPQYITNPEILAGNTRGRVGYPKKGIDDYFTNWDPARGGASRPIMQICNYGEDGTLKHPYSSSPDPHPVDEGPFQYMFNANNAAGVNALADAMKRVASMDGTQDYIFGNEVNVRKWCYISYMDWDTYVREYMQAFRVAYNAIMSTNANARVFICIDQCWDRNKPASDPEYYYYLDGKDFLAKFNSMVSGGGNINWGLAFHPHPVPLTYAKFWDMSALDPIYAQLVNTNAMVSFQNMTTITNYMQSGAMRLPSGGVRPMIASETGIPSGQGEDVQGAAMYAAYQACVRNPYVEIMIFSKDESTGAGFSSKAQEVYSNMGGPADGECDAWAKSVIGISDWGQVLR